MEMTELLAELTTKLKTWAQELVAMLPNLVLAVIVVVAFVYVARFARKGVRRGLKRATGNKPISDILGSVAHVSTLILGGFVALSLLELDKTVTSLLAGVGVIGLALGFAFQDIAANFMSGFLLAAKRPFDVGDQVEIDDRIARVKKVELRSTTVETTDGLTIMVPNKDVFQNAIVNYTKTPCRRLDVRVGVAYSDDLEEAQRVTKTAMETLEGRDGDREVEVFFEEFGGSSINLVARAWLTSSEQKEYVHARSKAIVAIKKAFDEASLNIPFPIRTLDFGARGVGGVNLEQMRLDGVVNDAANAESMPEAAE